MYRLKIKINKNLTEEEEENNTFSVSKALLPEIYQNKVQRGKKKRNLQWNKNEGRQKAK